MKANDETGTEIKIEMDSAMAGVVPAWNILDLIDDEEMIEMRKKTDGKIKKEIATVSLDTGNV